MHPSIERAYRERTHPLIKHPIHGVYGHDLARAAYEHLAQKYEEMTGSRRINMRQEIELLERAIQLEYPYRNELEEIAIDIVKEIWGITDEIKFVAELNPDPKFELQKPEEGEEDEEGEEEEVPKEEEELTPEEKKEVDKRITMNIMTHGAALHQMSTMHHMAADIIGAIDPQLLRTYDRIAKGSQYSAWFMDLEMILAQAGIQGGEVKIKWPEEKEQEGQEEEQEEGREPEEEKEWEPEEEEEEWEPEGPVTVYATAVVFPILLHELTKGVMEVLTAHGIPADPVLWHKVKKHADRPEHEFFHYLVGPEIWRRFIKVVGREQLPGVISALSRQEPDEVHKIIGAVVDDPERAQELLSTLIPSEEEEELEELEPEGEGFMECKRCKKSIKECRCSDDINQIANKITEDPDVAAAPAPAPPKEKPSPTAPPRKAPEKTPKKIPNPFRPPKPSEDPTPKAMKEEKGSKKCAHCKDSYIEGRTGSGGLCNNCIHIYRS